MEDNVGRLWYPEARLDSAIDTLAGVPFADPYRWLEQDSDEVREWQRAQTELASTHVRDWSGFPHLHALVGKFSAERYVAMPRFAGGKWFRASRVTGGSQAQAIVSDEPLGGGRILFDPGLENPKQPPFLSWLSPSPDGRTLAVGICTDGSEVNSIRLIDTATGATLAEPPAQRIMDNWTGGVHWLPDSSGFFFTAIVGSVREFTQETYLHRRMPTPQTVRVEVPWTKAKEWRMVVISKDGRHAVALERLRNPVPIAVLELRGDFTQWRPFITNIDGTVAGHLLGRHYVAVTDVDAPRGRLVAISLDAENPNETRAWRELVPESAAVLRTVTPVGGALYLNEFVDTYARIRVVDQAGEMMGEVPLPGRGAISEWPFPLMNLTPKGHPDTFMFAFSSLTSSWGIYSHVPGHEQVAALAAPQVGLDNVIVEDRIATSADGTSIPYQVVRPSDRSIDLPQPTLIHGYGGWNLPLLPQFPGAMAAFVAAGGTLVLAHLRGGAEFGATWWQRGRMRAKQNCYNDLFAIAGDLIAANRASPDTLAVTGSSNGGLMAGVAATQRPALWKVVVPRFPVLDLVGTCREAYGRLCASLEYADVQDPEDVRRLVTFSPYHLISEGTRYPAVYIDAGSTDPRCPAWHARKFAARLQKATASANPVLIHVWENVGHGWATDHKLGVEQNTEWLAFTLQHLGVELAHAQ